MRVKNSIIFSITFLFSTSFVFGQHKPFRTDYYVIQPFTIKSCFRTNRQLFKQGKIYPKAIIKKGSFIVFEFIKETEREKWIYSTGDTSTWADSEFNERITFQIKPTISTFEYRGTDLSKIKGLYEFWGGERPYPNTDFRITTGYVKGYKKNKNSWVIDAQFGVVDKEKTDSVIQQIAIKDTFKNCN